MVLVLLVLHLLIISLLASSTFANINSTGIITATSFSGDGINLTNVGAAQSTRTLQVWLFGGG